MRFVPHSKYTNPEARKRVRAWLLDYMERTGDSQADIARKLGIDDSAISRALSLRSLGFDVFAALMTLPSMDAHNVLTGYPKKRGRSSE